MLQRDLMLATSADLNSMSEQRCFLSPHSFTSLHLIFCKCEQRLELSKCAEVIRRKSQPSMAFPP